MYVWWEWGNWTAHNWFLQLLVTTGVIGVLLHLAGLASLAIHTQRFHRRAPALTTFVVLIAGWFLCWGILNSSYLGPVMPESIVFAVTIGLCLLAKHGDVS